jgi:hypothetical protein
MSASRKVRDCRVKNSNAPQAFSRSALLGSFMSGLAAMPSFGAVPTPIRLPDPNPWNGLRADWAVIGFDLSTVIERENAKLKTKSKSAKSA